MAILGKQQSIVFASVAFFLRADSGEAEERNSERDDVTRNNGPQVVLKWACRG